MRLKTKLFCTLAIVSHLWILCNCSIQRKTAGYYGFSIECLGVEYDGSETVLVMSDGRNRNDAIEQAKKEALREIIFNGVSHGKDVCDIHPLLTEVNANKKFENYFAVFFKDGGEYTKYVALKDERLFSKIFRDRTKGRKQLKFSVVCRVQLLNLKEKLISDKILNNYEK